MLFLFQSIFDKNSQKNSFFTEKVKNKVTLLEKIWEKKLLKSFSYEENVYWFLFDDLQAVQISTGKTNQQIESIEIDDSLMNLSRENGLALHLCDTDKLLIIIFKEKILIIQHKKLDFKLWQNLKNSKLKFQVSDFLAQNELQESISSFDRIIVNSISSLLLIQYKSHCKLFPIQLKNGIFTFNHQNSTTQDTSTKEEKEENIYILHQFPQRFLPFQVGYIAQFGVKNQEMIYFFESWKISEQSESFISSAQIKVTRYELKRENFPFPSCFLERLESKKLILSDIFSKEGSYFTSFELCHSEIRCAIATSEESIVLFNLPLLTNTEKWRKSQINLNQPILSTKNISQSLLLSKPITFQNEKLLSYSSFFTSWVALKSNISQKKDQKLFEPSAINSIYWHPSNSFFFVAVKNLLFCLNLTLQKIKIKISSIEDTLDFVNLNFFSADKISPNLFYSIYFNDEKKLKFDKNLNNVSSEPFLIATKRELLFGLIEGGSLNKANSSLKFDHFLVLLSKRKIEKCFQLIPTFDDFSLLKRAVSDISNTLFKQIEESKYQNIKSLHQFIEYFEQNLFVYFDIIQDAEEENVLPKEFKDIKIRYFHFLLRFGMLEEAFSVALKYDRNCALVEAICDEKENFFIEIAQIEMFREIFSVASQKGNEVVAETVRLLLCHPLFQHAESLVRTKTHFPIPIEGLDEALKHMTYLEKKFDQLCLHKETGYEVSSDLIINQEEATLLAVYLEHTGFEEKALKIYKEASLVEEVNRLEQSFIEKEKKKSSINLI